MSKRLISFSLWGNKTQYLSGAVRAVNSARVHYPGWLCRFYYDGSVPSEYITQLESLGAECWRKPDAPYGAGLFWRFEAMYDDQDVELFIVRDTDCDFTKRETVAVQEWIDSGEPFHVMRDNPAHGTEILGGMWGAVRNALPDMRTRLGLWFQTFTPTGGDTRSVYYGSDQQFLSQYVWPYAKDHSLTHDEHFHYTGREKPFTVQLADVGGHYVGMVV